MATKVSAEAIKKLRDLTAAGYLDCKKALEASQSDIEKAIEWLKAKGIKKSCSMKKSEMESDVQIH
jgi:elongation factor Ts